MEDADPSIASAAIASTVTVAAFVLALAAGTGPVVGVFRLIAAAEAGWALMMLSLITGVGYIQLGRQTR